MKRVAAMMAPWSMFVVLALGVNACGSDNVDSSPDVSPKAPQYGGPAEALSKACVEHNGVLDFEGRQADGYTEDWDIVCRDGTVRVVKAWTR